MTPFERWKGRVTYGPGTITQFSSLIERLRARRILLVTGRSSFNVSGADRMLYNLVPDTAVHRWNDFNSNVTVDDLKRGLDVARRVTPDLIVGVGGGSAMDMAKLLAAYLDTSHNLEAEIRSGTPITGEVTPLILVPTTSGSGSEATHFAVVYIGESKFSVAGDGLRPIHVILDPQLAAKGSPYQRANSGIDALCQSIESLWAVGATAQSERYARHALGILLPSIVPFVLTGGVGYSAAMLIGSHLSGRAIDISRTTGAHALSYFLTKRFGVPHGNAVALTLPTFIDEHAQVAATMPGDAGVRFRNALGTIDRVFRRAQFGRVDSTGKRFEHLVDRIGLTVHVKDVIPDIDETVGEWIASVNLERLSNNPARFTQEQVEQLIRAAWHRDD